MNRRQFVALFFTSALLMVAMVGWPFGETSGGSEVVAILNVERDAPSMSKGVARYTYTDSCYEISLIATNEKYGGNANPFERNVLRECDFPSTWPGLLICRIVVVEFPASFVVEVSKDGEECVDRFVVTEVLPGVYRLIIPRSGREGLGSYEIRLSDNRGLVDEWSYRINDGIVKCWF